jgi:oligopeptidase A
MVGFRWLTRRVEYDYPMVVENLERIQAPIGYSWGCVNHLMGVKNSPELREAHEKMQPLVVKTNQRIGQSQALFKALKAIQTRQSVWTKLDGAQKRIVDSSIRTMEASGVGLDDASRAVFNKLQLEAAELSSKFSNNVLDSTKAFKLRLTSPSDVEGLPESAK